MAARPRASEDGRHRPDSFKSEFYGAKLEVRADLTQLAGAGNPVTIGFQKKYG